MSWRSTVTGDTTGETTRGEVSVTAVIDLTDDEPEAAASTALHPGKGTSSGAAAESHATASEPFSHQGCKRSASGGEKPRKRIKISNPEEETPEEGRVYKVSDVIDSTASIKPRLFQNLILPARVDDFIGIHGGMFQMRDGKTIPMEVAVMKELAAGPPTIVGNPASVFLLDWYELRHQLILVLEMPDLDVYMWNNRDSMEEEQAKIIMKQLVEAVSELGANYVFHRDIKVQNILIETGADVPRVRLIDFGISCFCKKNSSFSHFYGTLAHIPPECLAGSGFNAADCQDLLQMCLSRVPEDRPTLREIQYHPWLT